MSQSFASGPHSEKASAQDLPRLMALWRRVEVETDLRDSAPGDADRSHILCDTGFGSFPRSHSFGTLSSLANRQKEPLLESVADYCSRADGDRPGRCVLSLSC